MKPVFTFCFADQTVTDLRQKKTKDEVTEGIPLVKDVDVDGLNSFHEFCLGEHMELL